MDYGFFKAFEQVREDVASILILARKDARNEAEIAALHAEIKQLVDEAAIDQAAKGALNEKIAAALARSQTAEDRLRSAIPK